MQSAVLVDIVGGERRTQIKVTNMESSSLSGKTEFSVYEGVPNDVIRIKATLSGLIYLRINLIK